MINMMGRQRLIAELRRDGLEVALPVSDKRIGVVAYVGLRNQVVRFAARPIHMVASNTSSFEVFRKYKNVADLIIAYVWHLERPSEAATYAMTYPQARALAAAQGWTSTPSWEKGGYSTDHPGPELVKMLEPFRMGQGRWWSLVIGGAAPPAQVATPDQPGK
jgi:hypothetical protein